MLSGIVIIRLGGRELPGRMTLSALEWLQAETGVHLLDLARVYHAEKDTPLMSRAVLIAAMTGAGKTLEEALEIFPADEVPSDGFLVYRQQAFKALNAGLFVPDLEEAGAKATAKKLLRALAKPFQKLRTSKARA